MEVFLQYVRHLPYPEQVPLLLTAILELREEFFQLGADTPCHPLLYRFRALNRLHLSRAHNELLRIQTFNAIYAEQPVPSCNCAFCVPTNRMFPPRERYQQMPEYERQMRPDVPDGPPAEPEAGLPNNQDGVPMEEPLNDDPEEEADADAEFIGRVAVGMVRAWMDGHEIPEVDDHVLNYMDF